MNVCTHLFRARSGVTVETWQIPFDALVAFSLHDKDGHIKFTVDPTKLDLATATAEALVRNLPCYGVQLSLTTAARPCGRLWRRTRRRPSPRAAARRCGPAL